MERSESDNSAPPSPATANEPICRLDSRSLFNGRNTVEIVHGDQRYLLRVTRENKLILTK